MDDQTELFPAVGPVDLSRGMTARSTRQKQPPTKKRSASTKNAILAQLLPAIAEYARDDDRL